VASKEELRKTDHETLQQQLQDKCSELRLLVESKEEMHKNDQALLAEWLSKSFTEAVLCKSVELTTLIEALRCSISEQCCELRELKSDRLDLEHIATTLLQAIQDTDETRKKDQDALEETLTKHFAEELSIKERDLTSCLHQDFTEAIRDANEIHKKDQDMLEESLKKHFAEEISIKSTDLTSLMKSMDERQRSDSELLAESLSRTVNEQCCNRLELKADKWDQDNILEQHLSFAGATDSTINDMRSILGSAATMKGQERLAEALNQSCRDLSSSVMDVRQGQSMLEQNCLNLSQSVMQYKHEVSTVGQTIQDFKRIFVKREQEIGDMERQWNRRLWGYTDYSVVPKTSKDSSTSNAQNSKDSSIGNAPRRPRPQGVLPVQRDSSPHGNGVPCDDQAMPWLPPSGTPSPPLSPGSSRNLVASLRVSGVPPSQGDCSGLVF